MSKSKKGHGKNGRYSTVYICGAECVSVCMWCNFDSICTIVEVIMVRYCPKVMPNSQPKGRMCYV